MADRFWVGGAGNWSSTTKWSATSGGASGASVPTSADVAIFDANSGGKFTATVDTAQSVNSLTITPSSGVGVLQIALTAPLTTGNLTTTGTAGNNRIWFRSTTYGISIDFVVNGTVSISDCDFRGLYVRGTAAPISGTRIGNRGECRGITFDAPRTVYWNLAGAQNWSANAWATTSTGTPSTDNFPLPQDTATFTNAGSVTGMITLDFAIVYIGSINMSARTSAMTIFCLNQYTVYGNWTNGSGITINGANPITFSGGTTQTITSAGKTFSGNITIDTYGGTVQLADAFNIAATTLTVTNGTFNTAGYAVTAAILSSSNSNVRTINLDSSTVTLTNSTGQLTFATKTNLTFNAGTSSIAITSASSGSSTLNTNGLVFNNFLYTNNSLFVLTITGQNVFNNLTFSSPSGQLLSIVFQDNQTINGTLTCNGASAVRRISLRSGTIGTPCILTVNAISATDCDFRDITLAGAASGASPTRAGNCGGNTGITFPAPKTVYWNLVGSQNWNATGWASSSGGTPDINNFPLAQDTAVFDNASSFSGTMTINAAWNIGTFDALLRTSAMTINTSTNNPVVYGDWKFGTGVTSSSTTGTINFSKNGTQTITSNGIQFNCPVLINHPLANVQLADALSISSIRRLTLSTGAFNAVVYNVTIGSFTNSNTGNTLRMGSGTWSISGIGSVWQISQTPIIEPGTSTIVLTDTSNSTRNFSGGTGAYYNKLTIGGSTGASTLSLFSSNSTYGELASTKTVAHTINFQTSNVTIGKWLVTGTLGNVVTIASNAMGGEFTLFIAGPANSGIDYLSIRDCNVAASPGEFYVGANSTNVSNNTGVIFTATPAPRTLYWVGGTGNWSSTTKWSTSSGGGSGAAIPTSLDAVVFDSLSNATAYTATIDAGVTLARCASFTMAGPLVGNVTFAGSVGIAFHGNVSFAATGITRTYTGNMDWAGNSSYTFTTNGLTLASSTTVTGIGSTWTLGSALLGVSSNIYTVTFGTFITSGYAITGAQQIASNNPNVRSIQLDNSTITFNGSNSSTFSLNTINLNFNAGTSSVISSAAVFGISRANALGPLEVTFYNVSLTNTSATQIAFFGVNTFNTLSFAGRTGVGITPVTFSADQTISTLTLNAGAAAANRTFLSSNTIGTPRTLTVGTLTAGAADIDFRDITIAGAAAPISGTRFGDAKGNSGITFDAAKTVFYRQTGSANWGATGSGSWSDTSGSALDATKFPLAQDTAVFPAATYPASGATTTINANYNIGTIDMSLRTTNTMTLATGFNQPAIYGNWINGTGTTLSNTGTMTFAGRGSQTITSAGKTFTQNFTIDTPTGSVALQDAFISNNSNTPSFTLNQGTFNANNYNVTFTSTASSGPSFVGVGLVRALAFGSGTWTIAGAQPWDASPVNFTFTGTGTLNLTSASNKNFFGNVSYPDLTVNQGGAGTLTITGNNTFKTITNTYSATGATTISLGNTTQTLTSPWTATGEAGRILTVSGTSAASPGILIFSGGGTAANVDYLAINNVRAYNLTNTWYAGANSTNNGTLGWVFATLVVTYLGNFFAFF
jgi:hypothetical protein